MILLPSLNRIDQLRLFFESARTANTNSPGLLIVDQEDYKNHAEEYNEIENTLFPNPGWKLVTTKAVSMGDKIREVWPLVENGNWVCVLNDDHRIITPHWDNLLIRQLDGANFVSCNDRWMAPVKAAGATLWSMELLKHIGWPIYPPKLQHLFIDDIWEKMGKASGAWKIVMNVVVEHHHAMKGESPQDATFQKVYAKTAWAEDEAIYREFMEKEFQNTVNKIVEFRKSKAVSVSNYGLGVP